MGPFLTLLVSTLLARDLEILPRTFSGNIIALVILSCVAALLPAVPSRPETHLLVLIALMLLLVVWRVISTNLIFLSYISGPLHLSSAVF